MAKQIKINQRDKYRTLLTDLLPLEVPLRFSLEGCYKLMKRDDASDLLLRVVLNSGKNAKEDHASYLPYLYKIRVGETRLRELGLFHPHLLCAFTDFYHDFSDVIVSQCRKSDWSVRHPSAVAMTFRPRIVFSGENPSGDEPDENSGAEIRHEVQANQSTFFAYESYRFYYEFLQSKEVEELEIEFSKCKRIDVAKCFHNIYTHSISWASKSKKLAKIEKNARDTFDARFDALMRNVNDGETHGILIGAEMSRVFAELILQQVDIDSLAECKSLGISESEYRVKRYLDDYHIYYNDERVALKVKAAISSSLQAYKLYLNEAKEEDSERPFITDLTLCKDEIRACVSGFSKLMEVSTSRKLKLSLFSEIRRITKEYKASYSDVSGYALSSIHMWICHVFDEHRAGTVSADFVEQAVHESINASYAVFSLDPKFRNSIWVNRIQIKCSRILKHRKRLDFSIGDRVRSEVQRMLAHLWKKELVDQIEVANVLASLREVPGFSGLPEWFLEDLHEQAKSKKSNPGYFWFVSMIDILSLEDSYGGYRDQVVAEAVSRVLSATSIRKSTEWLMFSIDLISCPYLNDLQKKDIATKLIGEFEDLAADSSTVSQLVNELSGEVVFFDWESKKVEELVAKKVLSFTY